MTVQNETDYEDLLSLWSDLEAGLAVVLGSPGSIQEFEARIRQYDRWMQTLLARDTDVGLYLLFQLSSSSSVGYSASHALISSVLCHLIANDLQLDSQERNALVYAAMTMNIAMTSLQDQLALQTEKLSPLQRQAIKNHPQEGAQLLAQLGIADTLWCGIVAIHHEEQSTRIRLAELPPLNRLTRILHVVDRYAAMISPRRSREGRSALESVRNIMSGASSYNDEVGHSLVRAVGLCPPGTYARLSDNSTAVVLRRSDKPNLPHVAVITDRSGDLLHEPLLHSTAINQPTIRSALGSAMVRLRLNHPLILQLGAYIPQAAR